MNEHPFHDLTAYLLGELSPEEHAAVERALAESPELRAELDGIRKTHAALTAHLAAETGPEPVAQPREPIPFPSKKPARRPLRFAVPTLAACAALGVAFFLNRPSEDSAPRRAEEVAPVAAAEQAPALALAAAPEIAADASVSQSRLASPPSLGAQPAEAVVASKTTAPQPAAAPAPKRAAAAAPALRSLPREVPAVVESSTNALAPNIAYADSMAPQGLGIGRAGGSVVATATSRRPGLPLPPQPPPRPTHGNRFDADARPAEFVKASAQPLSTFSADVNTASYAYARRSIADGRRPEPASIRLEEWLNHFAYTPHTAPDARHPITLETEASGSPWNPDRRLVRIVLRARPVEVAARPPSNLVFLIDTSGSMFGHDRLPLAQESLLKLLRRLDARDHVGIVTYAGTSGIAAEPTRCDTEGKAKLEKIILGLHATGSTNGADGLRDAYRLATRNLNPEGVNRVILATDGDFNVGLSGTQDLVDLAKREAGKKIFLTVLGFGSDNLNADLMKQLSVQADGNHFYIDSLKEAERVLAQKLVGTLVTVARDVKIQVDFNPARVGEYRLLGYETRHLANEDFNDDTKDAGEVGAGHVVTAVYEIIPAGAPARVDASRYAPPAETPAAPKPNAPVSDDWLTVKVRYQPPAGGESVLIEQPVIGAAMKLSAASSPDHRFALAVVQAATALRHGEGKDGATLDGALALLDSPGVLEGHEERSDFRDLLAKARHLAPRR